MKILIVGGTFDTDGGRPSGLVAKIITSTVTEGEQ